MCLHLLHVLIYCFLVKALIEKDEIIDTLAGMNAQLLYEHDKVRQE